LYWLVSRELWEYRSIYIAPLAVAGLCLLGFLINLFHLPENIRTETPMQQNVMIVGPYNFAALIIMLSTFLVAVFYCLESLHGERGDRSILFWKSLPVSDTMTVLAKACIPLVVLPVVTFAITAATQWVMLMMSSAVLLLMGQSAAPLWMHLWPLQMWLGLLYHLIAVHALWYAPLYGWLMLVSAWARRAPFLWAALPPLAIGVVEKIAFGTSHFATMLQHRIGGGSDGAVSASNGMSMDPLTMLTLGRFLISPGLWIGLGLAAIFLAGAVRLRRYRGPI
jgi:ABC-2 type transport system permease protein